MIPLPLNEFFNILHECSNACMNRSLIPSYVNEFLPECLSIILFWPQSLLLASPSSLRGLIRLLITVTTTICAYVVMYLHKPIFVYEWWFCYHFVCSWGYCHAIFPCHFLSIIFQPTSIILVQPNLFLFFLFACEFVQERHGLVLSSLVEINCVVIPFKAQ